MTIDTDTKLREGDIVSVQGKIELIYNSSATGEERIVIKLDGYYQSLGIAREHLTFVSPHIEEGMLVYDEDKEETYRVVSVLDGDWVVGRLRGIAHARPEILRSCALRVEDEPKRRKDDELPAAEPFTEPLSQVLDLNTWDVSEGTTKLNPDGSLTVETSPFKPQAPEPELGPTTLDEGYPTYVRRQADGTFQEHPRDDAAALVKKLANTVTDAYRKGLEPRPSDEDAEQEPRRTGMVRGTDMDSF